MLYFRDIIYYFIARDFIWSLFRILEEHWWYWDFEFYLPRSCDNGSSIVSCNLSYLRSIQLSGRSKTPLKQLELSFSQKNRQADEAAKKAEVEDLQRQIAQMKALQSNLPANNKKKGSVSNKVGSVWCRYDAAHQLLATITRLVFHFANFDDFTFFFRSR